MPVRVRSRSTAPLLPLGAPAAVVPLTLLALASPAAPPGDAAAPPGASARAASAPRPGTPVVADTATPDWTRLTGTYRMADGRLLLVWDLVDHMPEGSHQLAAFEPESGWLRTLTPESPTRFDVGSGWFAPEPREGRIHFDPDAGRVTRMGPADTLGGALLPLRRRPVTVPTDDGVTLAGEIVLPPEGAGRPPYPGLIMIPGSGVRTRRSPRVVADQYAAAGLAVLIHDRRGSGGSSGTFVPGAVDQFARDAAAALSALRSRPEVDGERVGVMAASLGGLVAPLLHREDPDWEFFVCRVCPAVPLWETELLSLARQGRDRGLPATEILDALARKVLADRYAAAREDYEALQAVEESTAGEAWREVLGAPSDWRAPAAPDSPAWNAYRSVVEIDPWALYRELDVPTLLILGEYDARLPGELHAAEARRAFERGADGVDKQVWVLPRASHGLMVTEFDREGRRKPFRRYVPDWHGRMVRWAARRAGLRAEAEEEAGAHGEGSAGADAGGT